MNHGKMLFSQLMEFASDDIFKWCVKRYDGNYKVKEFTCWKQFLYMVFGQLTHRESMSDTALCLKLHAKKLYHLGIGKPIDKSTISRANETRDWRIYRDFAIKLIEQAKCLCADENQLELKLKGGIYALDSTVVDLCLNVFWWAKFRTTKAAIKINTLLDLKTSIPDFIFISEGAIHDVNALDHIVLPSGSYLVMDKAYIDFGRLWKLNKNHITFIVRAKENMDFKIIVRKKVDRSTGIVCDQIIELCGINSSRKYPQKLRRVRYYDKETGNMLVFLTNNFKISALTIASLYRYRWGIETFFKWIKQHLKILSFWGHSENAVKTQIWIAISTYVIVIIAKKKLNLSQTLYEILQMISLSPFERTPLIEFFSEEKYQDVKEPLYNQLKLF
jgi:transposase